VLEDFVRIGQLARSADVKIDTVRYYEKQGLISAKRTTNGYRTFDNADLDRLRFIRRCRKLGMSLPEVRHLLGVVDQPETDCITVDRLIKRKIEEVRDRVASLQALEHELQGLLDRCQAQTTAAHCGILRELTVTPSHQTAAGGPCKNEG
jgi:DNA-binding transcriptional MerR regulator